MITISLREIEAHNPCEDGWEMLLASKGGDGADYDLKFPMTDILESNDFDDTLWAMRCKPEHNNLCRKLAVSYARDVQHLMTDQRSIDALDVAWRHSDGLATDVELTAAAASALTAALDAAGAAARAAVAAAGDAAGAAARAAWDAAWDAALAAAGAAGAAGDDARQKQQARLVAVLTTGEWVEVGNE